MTWKSHIAIATAITLPFNTMMIPVTAIGATAPDWLEWVLKFAGFKIEHRLQTHYLIIPIFIIIFSLFIDFKHIIFWFGIGYLSHWIADALTVSGVPIAPNARHKIHLFGGSIRTGEAKEYIYSFSFLAISIFIFKGNIINFNNDSVERFNVYNMSYKQLYKSHIISAKEYRINRFKLF